MAFRHGKNAAISIAGKDLSVYCENIDFNIDVDTADTTTFAATWKTALAGIPGGKLEMSGYYDPTASTGPAAVLTGIITGGVAWQTTGGSPVTLLYYPGGNTSGQRLATITTGAIVTSYAETSPVGGIVSFKASVLITVIPVFTVV
jgi:hypothetical protein